ncbi:MAG: DUF488 domain-containing protein [Candidatus Methylomirabilales bacterium]
MIRIKRVYEPPDPSDGFRVLVDRLWPRGLAKEKARIDKWQKDLAPSDALRRWFGHDPRKWEEFKRRYRQELGRKTEELKELAGHARHGTVTLLYAARDEDHNNAVALKELVEEHS